jgi:hypothetical protein
MTTVKTEARLQDGAGQNEQPAVKEDGKNHYDDNSRNPTIRTTNHESG